MLCTLRSIGENKVCLLNMLSLEYERSWEWEAGNVGLVHSAFWLQIRS